MCFGSTQISTNTQQQQQNQFNQQQQQNTSQQTSQQMGSSMVTPITTPGYNQLQTLIPGGYQSIWSQLQQMQGSTPYGPQQQTNFQQQLNQQMEAAQQRTQSQLASSGALNSARAGQATTAINLGGAEQMGNYLAQLPALNAAYKQNLLGNQAQLLGQAGNYRPVMGTSSVGQTNAITQALQNMFSQGTSTGSSAMQGSSSQTTSQNPLGAVLGGLLNAGLGFLTGGLSNMAGGGGFFGGGGGQSQAPDPTSSGYNWGAGNGYVPAAPSLPTNYMAPGSQPGPPSVFNGMSGYLTPPPYGGN